MSGTVQRSEGAGGPAAREQHAPDASYELIRSASSGAWAVGVARSDLARHLALDDQRRSSAIAWIGRILGYARSTS